MIRAIVIIEDTETGDRTEEYYDFSKKELEAALLSPEWQLKLKLRAMADRVAKEALGQ